MVDEVPEARLRIAGAASEETRRRLLERIGVPEAASVTFLGQQSDEQLVREYGAAWCVAMPAVYEALGLVTLEALSCGTPVVGARSGATPELVGECGALFEPGDAEDGARALVASLGNRQATNSPRSAAGGQQRMTGTRSAIRRRCGFWLR